MFRFRFSFYPITTEMSGGCIDYFLFYVKDYNCTKNLSGGCILYYYFFIIMGGRGLSVISEGEQV